jgi:hypothetical protein
LQPQRGTNDRPAELFRDFAILFRATSRRIFDEKPPAFTGTARRAKMTKM